MSSKPIIAVTMGDPAGIGPEIIIKALADPKIAQQCRPLILGDWGVLQRAQKGRRGSPRLVCWQPGQRLLPMLNSPGQFVVCSLSALTAKQSRPAVASVAAGHGTYRYIRVAAKLALSKVADAIATAPISKSSLIDAGYNYPGHTELLAELSGTKECRMMLIANKLRVVPVTGHIAFSKVSRSLSVEGIASTVALAHGSLRDSFKIARPKIAVAALNPHAGEAGIFGREEIDIITPAVKQARRRGVPAVGPFAADSLFHRAARGDFDAVVCMYHDQGLIPLKLHNFYGGVAFTLGPPFIRTSVDHGTAYDIAGKGKADPTSIKEAILLAARLARRRRDSDKK